MKNKDGIIEHLKTTPIIQVACQKSGINKSTFYRWYKKDKKFKERVRKAKREGFSFINDLAESQLITLIKEKHPTAIFYWLNNHKRPYSDKKVLLNPKEKFELMDSMVSYEPLSAYRLLLKKTIQGKIPKFLFNMIISVIFKSAKFQKDDLDFSIKEKIFLSKKLEKERLSNNFSNEKMKLVY